MLHVYFGKSHSYRQRQERDLLHRCARQAPALVQSDFFQYFNSDEQPEDLQNPIPRLDDDFIWMTFIRHILKSDCIAAFQRGG